MPKKIGRPRKDLSGQRFGKRLVLGLADTPKNANARWHVRCDCGHEFTCLNQDLWRMGPCRMCGHKGPRINRRKRPYEAMYNIFVGRAKYPVSITYEQFVEFAKIKHCHYCDDEIFWKEYRTDKTPGGTGSNLDRKDSSLPYSFDNIVVCCGRCNYAKNDHFTYEEWMQLGAVIRSWRYIEKLKAA